MEQIGNLLGFFDAPSNPDPDKYTREWLIAEFKQNIAVARDAGRPGDANKALQLIGNLLGFSGGEAPPSEPAPGEVPGTNAPVPVFDPSMLAQLSNLGVEADEE